MSRGKLKVRRKFLFFFLPLLCIFITLMILTYPLWLNVGGFQRTLDSRLVPTAEYMLIHPVSTPAFIGSISPPIGATIGHGEKVCLSIFPGGLSNRGDSGELSRDVAGSLRIVINTQVIPIDATQIQMVYIMHTLDDGRHSGLVNVCFSPDLATGIHIFQVEMRNSILGAFGIGEIFSYSWAYKVQ